mgnify:FL=1
MRKKSIRLVSAALAACMMASTLPVGAFALEAGTNDAVAAVSEQKAVKPNHLQGGETINDTFVEANGAVYTLSGDYTREITVEATKNITINVNGKVTINNVYTFLNITGSGMVTINGTKDGVDQEIENKRADWGETIKMAENTNVVCNGGKYKSSGWNPNHNCSSPDVFYSEGTLELRNVTAEVEGFGDAIVASGNLTIDGGTFRSGVKASGPNQSHSALCCSGTGIIYGGTFETMGYDSAVRLFGDDITISGSTLRSNSSCLTVGGATVVVDNCTLEHVGDKGSTAFLYMEGRRNRETNVTIQNSTCLGSAEKGFSVGYYDFAYMDGAEYVTLENITVKGCKKAISIDYDPKNNHERPNIALKNVTFEDNETDIYLKNDGSTPANAPHVELDESTKDTAGAITVEVAYPAEGVQITTKNTGKDYQQNLKLTSKNDGWLIGYKKDADGEYRYLTQREGNDYYGLNTINATATTGEGDNVTTLKPYAQLKEGTPVKLTADIPDNARVTGWKVEKIAAEGVTEVYGVVDYDHENPETATLTMPDYDIFVTAEYKEGVIIDPGTGDTDYGGDIAAGVVIGGIAAVGAYEVGTGLYRITQMDDVAMPTNRLALAKLLWERAGKPEPESTALYSDISAEDTDAQKAARWAVEQELLKDDTNEDEQKFHPAFPVSKLRVCLTWEKAKQKGLFDQNTEA